MFFLGQTREVRRNYSLTYIHGPIYNMRGKNKNGTYLLSSERTNVEMKSRREDTARRKEEKRRMVGVEKLQVRRIGCTSRLRRGLEDRCDVD
jgi:hypothetical protein